MNKVLSCALSITLAIALAIPPLNGSAEAYAAQTAGAPQYPVHATAHAVAPPRIGEGGSYTLPKGRKAALTLEGGTGRIIWKSSNKRVATVSQKGIVRGKNPGISVVTARDATTGLTATCAVKVYRACTQKKARRIIMALKRRYRPGRTWTNADYYFWQAKLCHCYGCAAFAGIASDAAFGKFAPLTRHDSFKKIKVGDHVRIAGKHSVVVLRRTRQSIIVAEGNYAGTIRWGREIGRSTLSRKGFYVETRY